MNERLDGTGQPQSLHPVTGITAWRGEAVFLSPRPGMGRAAQRITSQPAGHPSSVRHKAGDTSSLLKGPSLGGCLLPPLCLSLTQWTRTLGRGAGTSTHIFWVFGPVTQRMRRSALSTNHHDGGMCLAMGVGPPRMGLVEDGEWGLWVGAPGLGELSEALSLEPAMSWVWTQH